MGNKSAFNRSRSVFGQGARFLVFFTFFVFGLDRAAFLVFGMGI
jgi:hypothetical protein